MTVIGLVAAALASGGAEAKVKSNTQVRLPDNLYLGDIDGDGNQDFVSVRRGVVYVAKTDLGMHRILRTLFTASVPISRLIIGDFEVSGREHGKDQICAIQTDGNLSCWAISDDKTTMWWWFTQGNFVGNDEEAIVGDFTGDGADDILVYKPSTGDVRMYTRQSNGFFGLVSNFALGNLAGVNRVNKQLRAGEFGQAAGRADLLMFDPPSGQVLRYDTATDPSGNTSFFWAFTTATGVVSTSEDLAVANVDGGIHDDVVLRNRVTGAYRFCRLEYASGNLQTLSVDPGPLPANAYGQMFWLRNRGAIDTTVRDDALLWVPSSRQWISTYAEMNGSTPIYVANYTQGPLPHIPGDIDGDQRSDLALLGNPTWGSVPVGTSNGDGTFQVTNAASPGFAYWAGRPGAKVVYGDFNGDGLTDLAEVGGAYWASIPVDFSNGDGSFTFTNVATTDATTFGYWAMSPHVKALTGDFNGDGRTDIALTGVPGWASVPVAFSNGDGTFYVMNWPDYSSFPGWASQPGVKVVSGDFNADGKADLALVGGTNWASVPIAYSVGDGTFQVVNEGYPALPTDPASDYIWFDALAGDPTSQVVAADFDGNGYADLALVGGRNQGTIVPIALNQGNNLPPLAPHPRFNFIRPTATPLAAEWAQKGVAAVSGYFDDDAFADIVLVGGTGSGRVTTAAAITASVGLTLSRTVTGFSLSIDSTDLAPYAGQVRTRPIGTMASNARRAAPSLDQNGDGRADFALIGHPGWTSMPVAYSQGNGTFSVTNTPIDAAFFNYAAQTGVAVVSGDFNGDGREDVALTNTLGAPQQVALANGDGSFRVVSLRSDPVGTCSGVHILSGDFNADGFADLIAVGGTCPPNPSRQNSTIWYSNGDGTFWSLGTTDALGSYVNQYSLSVAAGDFNGDGATDLIAMSGFDDTIYVELKAQALEAFTPLSFQNATLARTTTAQLVTGDFDGDGLSDLYFVGDGRPTTMIVGVAQGDGTFSPLEVNVSSFAGWSRSVNARPVVGDFDGDGTSDIALVKGAATLTVPTPADAWTTVPVAFSNGDSTGFTVTNDTVSDIPQWSETPGETPASENPTATVHTDSPPAVPPPPAMASPTIKDLYISGGMWISPQPIYSNQSWTVYFDLCNPNDVGSQDVLPFLPYMLVLETSVHSGAAQTAAYYAYPDFESPNAGNFLTYQSLYPWYTPTTQLPYSINIPGQTCQLYEIYWEGGHGNPADFVFTAYIGYLYNANSNAPLPPKAAQLWIRCGDGANGAPCYEY